MDHQPASALRRPLPVFFIFGLPALASCFLRKVSPLPNSVLEFKDLVFITSSSAYMSISQFQFNKKMKSYDYGLSLSKINVQLDLKSCFSAETSRRNNLSVGMASSHSSRN